MSDSRLWIRRRVRIWADALTYACTLTILAGVASGVLAIATGGGSVRAKELLFVTGWILLAYATIKLWPTSPEDLEEDRTGDSLADSQPTTRFQRLVRALPPNRWVRLPRPERRMTTAGRCSSRASSSCWSRFSSRPSSASPESVRLRAANGRLRTRPPPTRPPLTHIAARAVKKRVIPLHFVPPSIL